MSTKSNEVLLSLEDICKYFKVSGGTLKAVDHVSFDIQKPWDWWASRAAASPLWAGGPWASIRPPPAS